MFLVFIISCSYFEQNDFVERKIISNEPDESIFYSVYQTGLDYYRFEFYTNYQSDSTKLFNYHLDDAVYTVMKFSIVKNEDTVKIKTNMPTEKIYSRTKNKTIVMLTNE